MGRKGRSETPTAILLAFLESGTWRQKDLAERCEVTVKVLKTHLDSLTAAGFPLERDFDPPNVYWSVPKDWFPGAVAFRSELLTDLLRVLTNSPHGETRKRLLDHIASGATGLRFSMHDAVVTGVLPPEQETNLWEIEDCVQRRVAVHMRYYSMSRGDESWRHVSVHRVVVGDVIRLIATCHRDDTLKWFRLDNVWYARPDKSTPFRECDLDRVARFATESVDGFHSGEAATECRFRVRLPEARWVKAQLSLPVFIKEGPESYSFNVRTAGVLPLARFVAGLGSAATCETLELGALVRELANGALDAGVVGGGS